MSAQPLVLSTVLLALSRVMVKIRGRWFGTPMLTLKSTALFAAKPAGLFTLMVRHAGNCRRTVLSRSFQVGGVAGAASGVASEGGCCGANKCALAKLRQYLSTG